MQSMVAREEVKLPIRTKRMFSREQKQAMLDEAAQPGSSVCGVARKYNVASSQIFTWRKEMTFGNAEAVELPESQCGQQGMLAKIGELETKVGAVVIDKFVRDVRIGQISSYNAAIGYSSLVNAFIKLGEFQLQVFDRLAALPPEPVSKEEPDSEMSAEKKRELARFSEKLLAELHKQSRPASA